MNYNGAPINACCIKSIVRFLYGIDIHADCSVAITVNVGLNIIFEALQNCIIYSFLRNSRESGTMFFVASRDFSKIWFCEEGRFSLRRSICSQLESRQLKVISQYAEL